MFKLCVLGLVLVSATGTSGRASRYRIPSVSFWETQKSRAQPRVLLVTDDGFDRRDRDYLRVLPVVRRVASRVGGLGVRDLGVRDIVGVGDLGVRDLGVGGLGVRDMGYSDYGVRDVVGGVRDVLGGVGDIIGARGA